MIIQKGEWLTNHPKPLNSFWPRRPITYVEGDPKETSKYSVEDLIAMDYIGIYSGEDVIDYFNLPRFYNQKDIDKFKNEK
jgi:hypothetical protein